MTVGDGGAGIVRWKRGDGEVKATFETIGRFLVLTTPYGVHRTALGLQNPRKLACRLLRNICERNAADPLAAAVPDAALIDAMTPVDAASEAAGPPAAAAAV